MTNLTTQQIAEINLMIARFDAAIAAGQKINEHVAPVVAGAKAALACTDAAWLARASKMTAKEAVLLAAQGDLMGYGKLI